MVYYHCILLTRIRDNPFDALRWLARLLLAFLHAFTVYDFCTIKRTVSGGLIAGIFGQALPFPQCRYFCAQFCAIRATSHYLCIYALPCTTASRLFTPIPPATTSDNSTISAHTFRLIITRAIRLISDYHSLRHAPCYQSMNRRICIHAPCQSFITPCTAIYAPNAETS